MELHLFDFDGTLFRSPHIPAVWNGEWWNDARSISPPCVPESPDQSWWVDSTVRAAKRSSSDSKVWSVLATGRENSSKMRSRILDLLAQRGLDFDEVHLSPAPDTISWKRSLLEKLINKLGDRLTRVRIWDDRLSHLPQFKNVCLDLGVPEELIELNEVRAGSKDPECGENHNPGLVDTSLLEYLAIFLDARSRALLSEKFPPLHGKLRNDHVTLGRKSELEPGDLDLIGQRVNFNVTGYVSDEYIQVVRVQLPSNIPWRGGSRIPHVTLSRDGSVTDFYSNSLLSKGDLQRVSNLKISGVVDSFPRSLTRGEF